MDNRSRGPPGRPRRRTNQLLKGGTLIIELQRVILSDDIEENPCGICGLDQVAMPEAWTGSGLVNFFDAGRFVKMLEDSLQEA